MPGKFIEERTTSSLINVELKVMKILFLWYNHLVAAENPHGLLAIAPSVRVNAVAKVTFVLAIKGPMY